MEASELLADSLASCGEGCVKAVTAYSLLLKVLALMCL